MLCVVVPTYNEASNIQELLRSLFALILTDLYVFVIDDSSPDGTAFIAEEMSSELDDRVFVFRRSNKDGLGTAYLFGFAKVFEMFSHQYTAFHIAQMDADFSHNPNYIPSMLELLEKYDIVIGSRYVSSGSSDDRKALSRRVLSRFGNQCIRWISGVNVNDVTSGFKVFRSEVLAQIDRDIIRCKGFGFQAEMAYQCHEMGFQVYEFPIEFADRINGRSKMSKSIIFEALWKISVMRIKSVFKRI